MSAVVKNKFGLGPKSVLLTRTLPTEATVSASNQPTNGEEAKSKRPLLSLLFAVAALTTGAAIAQTSVPGYLVVEYEVVDAEAWAKYSTGARALTNIGKFVVRGAKGTGLVGDPPKSITLLKFSSVEEAIAFDNSPQYVALKPLRDKGAKWRSYVVPGVPE